MREAEWKETRSPTLASWISYPALLKRDPVHDIAASPGFRTPERHLALVLQVLGQIDPSHAALTEFTLDRVAAFQGCVQACGGIRHGDKMRDRRGEGQRGGVGYSPPL